MPARIPTFDSTTGQWRDPVTGAIAAAPVSTTYTQPQPSTAGQVLKGLGTGAGYAGAGLTALNLVAPSVLGGTMLASAPLTMGLSLVPLAILELSKIRQGARTATEFVNTFQDKFLKDILAPLSTLSATDPQSAAEQLAQAWPAYLKEANTYAEENPMHAKVVQQMLYQTPELTDTVSNMLKPLGVDAFNPQFLSGKSFQSTNNGPSALAAAAPAIIAGGAYGAGKLFGGNVPSSATNVTPGAADNPMEIPAIPQFPGGLPNIPGISPASNTSNTSTPVISSGASTAAGILGKIFGVTTTGGDQSIVDQLIKLGVPLTGAVLNGVSASKAADTQANASDRSAQLIADAAKNSLDFEKQVYGDQQTQTAPYRAAGTAALDKIQALLGIGTPPADGSPRPDPTAELAATPRYKLDFSEGIKALHAANRGIVSGQTIKAAERFGQGLADKTFDSTFGNLGTVAGFGQTGTAQNLNAGLNAVNTTTGINRDTAVNVGNSGEQAAAARASGYGQGAFSQVLSELQKQQLLKQLGI